MTANDIYLLLIVCFRHLFLYALCSFAGYKWKTNAIYGMRPFPVLSYSGSLRANSCGVAWVSVPGCSGDHFVLSHFGLAAGGGSIILQCGGICVRVCVNFCVSCMS